MSTHFNFNDIIPGDLGLDPQLNPISVEKGDPSVYIRFGPLMLTLRDAGEAQQIADAPAEGARLLREAHAAGEADNDEGGAS